MKNGTTKAPRPSSRTKTWVARNRVKAWNRAALYAERKVRESYDRLVELEAA